MNYSDLLKKSEWIKKSASIIYRDSYKCQMCGSLGFHSMSLYECKNLKELDNLFNDWSLNNVSFSTFIEKEIQAFSNTDVHDNELKRIREFSVTPIDTYNNEIIKLRGYSFLRLSASVFDLDFINRDAYCYCKQIPKIQPIYQRHLVEKDTDNVFAKALKITVQNNLTAFEYGNIYMFENNVVDECVVSIEYIYPTGPNGILTNEFPKLFGSIIVNVSFKNFVGSFYFFPKDTNSQNVHKKYYIKGLNVHHKFYIKGLAPWEYEDDALITLCEDCHKKIHQTHVPVYQRVGSKLLFEKNTKTCERCNGTGYLPQYSHIENGICFSCWGEGVVLDDLI